MGRVSAIPAEREALRGLAEVNQELVLGRRSGQKIATIVGRHDHRKPQASGAPTYQGSRDQPMLALWAELDVAVADQFRDGNCRRCKIR